MLLTEPSSQLGGKIPTVLVSLVTSKTIREFLLQEISQLGVDGAHL